MFRVCDAYEVKELGIDCYLLRRAFAQPLLHAVDDLGGRRKCVVIRAQNEHAPRRISCVNLGTCQKKCKENRQNCAAQAVPALDARPISLIVSSHEVRSGPKKPKPKLKHKVVPVESGQLRRFVDGA
jgi:hypothetical protein